VKTVKDANWRADGRGIWSTPVSLTALIVAGSWVAPAALAASLTGRVADVSGIKSLQSAEVEIVELQRRAQTASDGTFRFGDIPDGTYTLRTQYVGAATVETKVVVSGETRTGDILLGTGSSDAGFIDNVLVVGQRASLASALSRQRSADGVESVLSRDGIGQFPDQNAAESLRRVAGINVLNDQGEGRFVAVRGLSPDLNAASINGARVPAPEADVRSVALDVIPAELIESIEIKKSLTPDMDADTIGASIEINTTSALDRHEPYLSFSAEGSFNDLRSDWSPKGSLDFSTRLGERLGIAGGLSYYKRRFSTDNIEMEGWDESDGMVFADTVEYRDYDVERQRLGGSLSLDFRASDSTTLYARWLRSEFEDQEYRGRLIFDGLPDPVGGDENSATFASGEDAEIELVRDIKDRFEKQTIDSLNVGGETFVGAWTFKYNGSWSTAKEREAGSLDPVEFQREFSEPGELGVRFDYRNWVLPRYTLSGAGVTATRDPREFEFDEIERTSLSLSEDEELAARFDIARDFALDSGQLTLQFGAKARLREKTYDLQLDVFDGFDGDFTLADVAGLASYGLNTIGPVPSGPAVRDFIDRNMADFERNDVDSTFESSIADYRVGEDIYAGYVLGRLEQGPLRFVGGVRVERTRNDVRANAVRLVEDDEDATVEIEPTRFDRDYTDVLPSLNVRYQSSEDVLLRAGLYRSLVRPRIGQLAPRFVLEDDEATSGNPELKPYDAWNLDLSAEWYLGNDGVLQGGVFFKRIQDFIVDRRLGPGQFQGIEYEELVIAQNGDQAEVRGFEFNYQQALHFLPAPLDGLLLGFNYTYTDAEGEIDGESVALPASAEHTFNASLGYEKGRLSLRITAAYRDKYLDELGDTREEDRYVEDFIQYDMSVRYRVTPQLQVFTEFVNLGNEPYVAYQNFGGRKRLLQYEEYSWTSKLGFRYSF
jgi:TonB-dependent receptor